MYFIRCNRWKNEIWIIQLVNSKEINSPNHFHFVLGAIENENNEEEVPSQKISLLVVSRRIFTVITSDLDDMQDNHLDNVRDQRPKSVVIDSVVRQPFFEISNKF